MINNVTVTVRLVVFTDIYPLHRWYPTGKLVIRTDAITADVRLITGRLLAIGIKHQEIVIGGVGRAVERIRPLQHGDKRLAGIDGDGQARIPLAEIVKIVLRVTIVGVKFLIHRSVVPRRIIACGSHIHHTSIYGILHCLRHITVLKDRFGGEADIIHNNICSSVDEIANRVGSYATLVSKPL